MSYGRSAFGSARWGSFTDPTGQAHTAYSTLTDSPSDLAIGSPILHLWELEAADGSYYRVVDFGHAEASTTAGQVTYDGDEYISVRIKRTAVGEATNGAQPEVTLTVTDSTRVITQFVNDNDALRGAKAHLHIIKYSDIETPALATNRTFKIAGVRAVEGPASVAVTLSSPLLAQHRYPRLQFNRLRCINPWARRFVHNGKNHCGYPSDEFGPMTRQLLTQDADTATEAEHGWYVLNGAKPSLFYSDADANSGSDKCCYCTGGNASSNMLWDDGTRNGVYLYKIISATASETDVDVYTKLHCYATMANSIAGICVQSRVDNDDWVFWGVQMVGGTTRHLYRETINGTSTDTTYTGSEAGYRLARSGNSWTCYVRDDSKTARTLSEGAWTQKHTDTAVLGSSNINVGLVFALDTTGAAGTLTFAFDAYHFRYLAGGYDECDHSLTQCESYGNDVHFGGVLGLPDGIGRW